MFCFLAGTTTTKPRETAAWTGRAPGGKARSSASPRETRGTSGHCTLAVPSLSQGLLCTCRRGKQQHGAGPRDQEQSDREGASTEDEEEKAGARLSWLGDTSPRSLSPRRSDERAPLPVISGRGRPRGSQRRDSLGGRGRTFREEGDGEAGPERKRVGGRERSDSEETEEESDPARPASPFSWEDHPVSRWHFKKGPAEEPVLDGRGRPPQMEPRWTPERLEAKHRAELEHPGPYHCPGILASSRKRCATQTSSWPELMKHMALKHQRLLCDMPACRKCCLASRPLLTSLPLAPPPFPRPQHAILSMVPPYWTTFQTTSIRKAAPTDASSATKASLRM